MRIEINTRGNIQPNNQLLLRVEAALSLRGSSHPAATNNISHNTTYAPANMRAWILAGVVCAIHRATARSVQLELDAYFNNQAFSTYPGESSFDDLNQSYPAVGPDHNGHDTFVSGSGMEYTMPGYRGPSTLDNVICAGQTISFAQPRRAFALSVLHASDVRKKTVLGNITFTYSDGSMYVPSVSCLESLLYSNSITHSLDQVTDVALADSGIKIYSGITKRAVVVVSRH